LTEQIGSAEPPVLGSEGKVGFEREEALIAIGP
jgi:hypothetical protein